MSNRTVPAAAEGLPKVTRREALRTLAAGSAAGALTGGVAIIATPDPLLALVTAYSSGLDTYNRTALSLSVEEDAALMVSTWGPHYDTLCACPPDATTLGGAVAAIRLVLNEEETCGHHPGFTQRTLRAALAYFDGRA